MILIVVKFPVKAEHAEQWPSITADYTAATRAEPGNKWFEWSRSLEDPNEYVLVEAFENDGAEAHVGSEHFAAMKREWPQYLSATPKIVSRQVEGDDWDRMGELQVD